MNICGVLAHANPAKIGNVVSALGRLSGVEIHQMADGGRIVLTVEDTDRATAFDTMTAIHRLDGIVAAALTYHHFDPADETAAGNA